MEAGCQQCALIYQGILQGFGADSVGDAEWAYLTKIVGVEGFQVQVLQAEYRYQFDVNERDEMMLMGAPQDYYSLDFYVLPGSPLPPFPGVKLRKIAPQRTKETYMSTLLEWIDNCDSAHDCSVGAFLMPSRVLDVGSPEDVKVYDQIKLLDTRKFSLPNAPYVALSHCWGGDVALKTTKENYLKREQGIPFEDLPTTFQDAVTVTRVLGIKYLWIDATCIIQDSTEDWELESQNMADIYAMAYLVIGADMAPNSHTGFLKRDLKIRDQRSGYNRDNYDILRRPFVYINNPNDVMTNTYILLDITHSDPFRPRVSGYTQPLHQRAWAVQEQALARRMVHFTTKELVWQCRESYLCECKQLDRRPGLLNTHYLSNAKAALLTCLRTSNASDRIRGWNHILSIYRERDLTNKMDFLPALSGMVRKIYEIGAGGRYLAGLWERDLPDALVWSLERHSQAKVEEVLCRRFVPYRAPTWSPASLEALPGCRFPGIITTKYSYEDRGEDSRIQPWAQIEDVEYVPSGLNIFGAVLSSQIKITGPIFTSRSTRTRHLEVISPPTDTDLMMLCSRDMELSVSDEANLYCLVIGFGESSRSNDRNHFSGLVLIPAPCGAATATTDMVFERVGAFHCSGQEYANNGYNEKSLYFKACPRKTIVII